MDVRNLLAHEPSYGEGSPQKKTGNSQHGYPGPNAHAAPAYGFDAHVYQYQSPEKAARKQVSSMSHQPSPPKPKPKHVSFELLLDGTANYKARLPMRVNIYPHDETESIITTVKNFFALYEGQGVSFEDKDRCTLIASWENLADNMVIYVRVIPEPKASGQSAFPASPSKKPTLGEPFQMLPPQPNYHISRPSSRSMRKNTASPNPSQGGRSASIGFQGRSRSRPTLKPRGSQNSADPNYEGYSSSDGGRDSISSSRRDQLASAEISLENIVEGGRRKRAKFESSELPLFVPPQVPMTTSISSVSPQRKDLSLNGASPFSFNNQHMFSYAQPLPSPQNHGQNGYAQAQARQLGPPTRGRTGARGRVSASYPGMRTLSGSAAGVLPTPDPTTVGSVISDEDVALQLMRLGDASNFSSHGRTSTSTVDDALSGKAEAASSAGTEDEHENDTLARKRAKHSVDVLGRGKYKTSHQTLPNSDIVESSGDEYEDGSLKGDSEEVAQDHRGKPVAPMSAPPKRSVKPAKPRTSSSSAKGKSKSSSSAKIPISPASVSSSAHRKMSSSSLNFQHQLGVDEEDLSSKPRCQRCRKSKKGCDRQRPCGRCKDAGIGIEGCVSEDEGNGRKGRYGRHMGVPVKKEGVEAQNMTAAAGVSGLGHIPDLSPAAVSRDKKRKR